MAAVVFGALSGVLFGAMTVAVRTALRRGADPEVGALVVAGIGALVSVPGAVVSALLEHPSFADLWPFALAGALVPGCSQILFILAVRDAGPSRAAILIGTTPLISVALAIALLGEPFRAPLLVGTVLVVGGGLALAFERTRPEHFRALGAGLALACAVLFAVRDNVVRSAAKDAHPPALAAALVSLAAAALVVAAYILTVRRARLRTAFRPALRAFAPAGIGLGVSYAALFEAFDHGRVSVVAPLNATQSIWAVVFSMLLLGRAADMIGRRLLVSGVLVVAGAALISVLR